MVLQTKGSVIILFICCILTIACDKVNKNIPVVSVDAQNIPMIHTTDASTLISDSGITRYRWEAKVWDIYSNAAEPYQYFPEKIHVEQFDSLFNVIGNIKADTAYYFEKKELWRAIGNVFVKNIEGRTFETSELFWDRKVPPDKMNAFYTDKFVKITEPNGDILYGKNGFCADQSLNRIRFFSVGGTFVVDESNDTIQQPHTALDSLQNP